MDNAKLAKDLISALGLTLPPVAISFSETAPANVPAHEGTVPSGCFFWQQGATQTFVTTAKDHALCPIGVHTHHLAGPTPSHQAELTEALKIMSDLDYVRSEEVAAIPVIARPVKHVVYGPLADCRTEPAVVLLFAHARHGSILTEAAVRVDKGTPPAMGRPACAVVPQAFNQQTAAMSLGCCGARIYLDALTDDVALWALPGSKLDQYCAEITVLARAHITLTTFHAHRREDVAAGKRPTVRQSIERLSS